MNNDPVPADERGHSRRRFLCGGMRGLGWLGFGGALGWISGSARAGKAAAEPGNRSLGPEFSYDLRGLGKTDPKLVQYQESGRYASGFKELRCIAVGPGGQVYLAGDRAIKVCTEPGSVLHEIALEEAPRCLAVGGDGALYVGMKDHVQVHRSPDVPGAKWETAGENAVLTSVAVGERDVFVADAGNRQVLHCDLGGKLLGRIGKKDPARNIPGFIVPSPYFDLAIGAEGLLWVANPGQHRLEAYTFDGDFEISWGEPSNAIAGFCGCCNPAHFAMLPDSRFVTSEKGLPRVKIYSRDGKFEGVVAGPEQFPKLIGNPRRAPVAIDVTVDSRGRVLLADPIENAVRIFTRLTES
ncbi:MAG: hypothetical protein M1608_15635 [Candidatus Omnitrophica bacterium]|nr:hypothetical protein [Candidatus Omnitrophota bacterium]